MKIFSYIADFDIFHHDINCGLLAAKRIGVKILLELPEVNPTIRTIIKKIQQERRSLKLSGPCVYSLQGFKESSIKNDQLDSLARELGITSGEAVITSYKIDASTLEKIAEFPDVLAIELKPRPISTDPLILLKQLITRYLGKSGDNSSFWHNFYWEKNSSARCRMVFDKGITVLYLNDHARGSRLLIPEVDTIKAQLSTIFAMLGVDCNIVVGRDIKSGYIYFEFDISIKAWQKLETQLNTTKKCDFKARNAKLRAELQKEPPDYKALFKMLSEEVEVDFSSEELPLSFEEMQVLCKALKTNRSIISLQLDKFAYFDLQILACLKKLFATNRVILKLRGEFSQYKITDIIKLVETSKIINFRNYPGGLAYDSYSSINAAIKLNWQTRQILHAMWHSFIFSYVAKYCNASPLVNIILGYCTADEFISLTLNRDIYTLTEKKIGKKLSSDIHPQLTLLKPLQEYINKSENYPQIVLEFFKDFKKDVTDPKFQKTEELAVFRQRITNIDFLIHLFTYYEDGQLYFALQQLKTNFQDYAKSLERKNPLLQHTFLAERQPPRRSNTIKKQLGELLPQFASTIYFMEKANQLKIDFDNRDAANSICQQLSDLLHLASHLPGQNPATFIQADVINSTVSGAGASIVLTNVTPDNLQLLKTHYHAAFEEISLPSVGVSQFLGKNCCVL